MKIKALSCDFSVCKIQDITGVDFEDEFCFLGKTDQELSLVCQTKRVPDNAQEREDGWKAFRIEGVLDFSLVGILAEISALMAESGIGIFAVSTYNTDYVLTKADDFERALAALRADGYEVAADGERTEYEKCMAGEIYDCHDPVFLRFKARTRKLLKEYNGLDYEDRLRKREILQEMFGSIGENVSVGAPFICDYGCNVHIGNHVSINMNCTFVDCNRIEIGSNVLISSNVQLYTSTHPTELAERLAADFDPDRGGYFCTTFARPIRIKDGAWLGGGVIVLPGVTIGEGSVIGAGSVVTKDVPDHAVAAGNPARVLRKLQGE